jgi:hypothetical protein
MVNGAQQESNDISVAVSDNQAQPGSWVFKEVHLNGLPAEYGSTIVDPNVVLLPDGTLSLFTTVFSNGNEFTAAFLSTDGGFTYAFRKNVYSDILDPENYRFSPTDWLILTGGPTGIAQSSDDGSSFTSLGVFQEREGAIHEISVSDKPGEYRVYFSSPQGITSYLSASAPWTDWVKEPGYRLQTDETAGLESCHLSFPTVIKLGPSNYVMFYLAVIPGCGCSDDPVCD